jgi:hypothetical protein
MMITKAGFDCPWTSGKFFNQVESLSLIPGLISERVTKWFAE